MTVKAALNNRRAIYGPGPVHVSSINFINRTFSWYLTIGVKITESFNDVTEWRVTDDAGNQFIFR